MQIIMSSLLSQNKRGTQEFGIQNCRGGGKHFGFTYCAFLDLIALLFCSARSIVISWRLTG